jgi:hypothetical protein
MLDFDKMLEDDIMMLQCMSGMSPEEYSKNYEDEDYENYLKKLDKNVPRKSLEELNAMSLREYLDYLKARYGQEKLQIKKMNYFKQLLM